MACKREKGCGHVPRLAVQVVRVPAAIALDGHFALISAPHVRVGSHGLRGEDDGLNGLHGVVNGHVLNDISHNDNVKRPRRGVARRVPARQRASHQIPEREDLVQMIVEALRILAGQVWRYVAPEVSLGAVDFCNCKLPSKSPEGTSAIDVMLYSVPETWARTV